MSRTLNDNNFHDEWNIVKAEFDRCAKLIKNYETRPLTDEERIVRYKNEIIAGFNAIIKYVADNIDDFELDSQDKLLEKIDNFEAILKNRLQILNFDVEFPPDRLDSLTNESVQRSTKPSTSVGELGATATTDTDLTDSNNINNKTDSEQANVNHKQNNTDDPLRNNMHDNTARAHTNLNMEKPAFVSLMASNIRKNYAGDPLTLSSFIASIDFLKEMATTADLLTLLRKFVITKLEGRAAEIVPDNIESIDALINLLREKIKHENSKVIEGRMMALRADRAKFQDYANQVEELSDALRRTLISDGMPQNLAERQVIDKTIELCRFNTQNPTVKSVLVSKHFENAKEVVAEFIIQSNTVRQEAQVLSFRKSQNGNFNNQRNFRQKNFNGRRNFRFSQNSNRSNRNYNGNRGRGNDNHVNNSRDNHANNGNKHFQGGRNANRNVRVAENVTATQSTLGSASE